MRINADILLDFERPYYGDKLNKCSFSYSEYGSKPGNYVIIKGSVVKYVGRSAGCVYKAAYRHFANWCKGPRSGGRIKSGGGRSKQLDTWYDRSDPEVKLAIILGQDAFTFEAFLISELKPTDNRDMRELIDPPKWYSPYEQDYTLIRLYEDSNHNIK